MKHITLLGGSGFIGKYIYENLKDDFFIETLNSQNCNLLESQDVEKYFTQLSHPSTIIFTSSIVRTVENNFFSYSKNVLMAENIAKFIEKSTNIEQIIFLSSIDVYGVEQVDIITSE